MTAKLDRGIRLLRAPPPPVPYTRTPRCCAEIKVQNESERRWRQQRYGEASFQCTNPSVVELDGRPLCGRHAGERIWDENLAEETDDKRELEEMIAGMGGDPNDGELRDDGDWHG